ncbi:MAG: stage II sporulation protein D [Peptostreptococcaceae bacterium]
MKNPLVILSGLVISSIVIPVLVSTTLYKDTPKDENKGNDSTVQKIEAKTDKDNKDEKVKEKSKEVINYETVNTESPTIKVYNHNKGVVESKDIEEYLYGVLSGEMSSNFDMEALKAQAIAARTFVMSKKENPSSSGHKSSVVCTNYKHCQEYKSEETLKSTHGEKWMKESYTKIKEAVNSTKGQILVYNDKPILPLYFSTSSGKTENSEEVFSAKYPYLKSVDSPYDGESPKYTSEVIISQSSFINTIQKNYSNTKINSKNLESDIKIVERSEGGSVEKIKIGNKEIKGTDIRIMFTLNSANFDIKFKGDDIVFSVKGYGHGVGMSQWGAQGMAEEGFLYYEILQHYYTGVKIKDLY